ncbi:hypothetical protein P368_10190 [Comamonas thiooxydans]|nr:hypothetical protein P365_10535 [Comamonas thiooxydans]KGH13590.1 hypothetical protein P368_10190 [Comamonas thiooxydans]
MQLCAISIGHMQAPLQCRMHQMQTTQTSQHY